MEAIEAATRRPAGFPGLTTVGTMEPEMAAGLGLVAADSLENVENTRRLAAVVARDWMHNGSDIHPMLSDIERDAARWSGTPTADEASKERKRRSCACFVSSRAAFLLRCS
jgi:hypothetical protein